MKKVMILSLSLMMLSGSAMAQEKLSDGQDSKAMRPKRVRMTRGMGGRGGGMQGGPRGGMPPGGGDSQQTSYDYDNQQTKYDKQMRKLLSDEQYEGYLKLKPQFYSQR